MIYCGYKECFCNSIENGGSNVKNFSIHMSVGSDMLISGDSLNQAVENNFQRIASAYHIGNPAGDGLELVRMEWQDGIRCGKGCVQVRDPARGSDALV